MTGTFHIVVAMKPLDGTFTQNAIKHSVAGLNIDGCRVASYDGTTTARKRVVVRDGVSVGFCRGVKSGLSGGNGSDIGRFPANVIHDGSDRVEKSLPNGSGRFFKKLV